MVNLKQWCYDVIHGSGGFLDFEEYEVLAVSDRDVAIAKFTIRSIARDNSDILDALIEFREKRATDGL